MYYEYIAYNKSMLAKQSDNFTLENPTIPKILNRSKCLHICNQGGWGLEMVARIVVKHQHIEDEIIGDTSWLFVWQFTRNESNNNFLQRLWLLHLVRHSQLRSVEVRKMTFIASSLHQPSGLGFFIEYVFIIQTFRGTSNFLYVVWHEIFFNPYQFFFCLMS